MRNLLVLVVIAGLSGAAGMLAWRLADRGPAVVGQIAPPLVLRDAGGREHALETWRGRWLLLNFWASWCAPCMEELPVLVAAQARHADRGLQILGPALDSSEAVAPVVARFGINYPVFPDYRGADAAMQALGNDQGALPYSVLIGPDGRVAEVFLGAFSEAALALLLERHLPTAD